MTRPRAHNPAVPPTQAGSDAAGAARCAPAADGDKLQREEPVQGPAAWLVIGLLIVAMFGMGAAMALLVGIVEEITGGMAQ